MRRADAKLLTLAAFLDTVQGPVGYVELLGTNQKMTMLMVFCSNWLYVPVIDGAFITDRPEALLADGKVNGDRIFTIHNYNEVRYFTHGRNP
jgi:hypothetical protein